MEKKYQSIVPLLLLIVINFLAALIEINNSDTMNSAIVEICLGMCFLNIAVYLLITFCSLGDGYIYIIVSMLSSVGIMLQLRFSIEGGEEQMKMYLIGVVCYFAAMLLYRAMHKYLKRMGVIFFLVSVALFMITLLFGISSGGAKNWISIGELSVQPGEFIKVLFVLLLSAIIANNQKEKKTKRKVKNNIAQSIEKIKFLDLPTLTLTVVTGIFAFFLLLQNEWGTMILIFVIYLAFLYIYGKSRLYFILNVLGAALVAYLAALASSHIGERVEAWIDPFEDSRGSGWHILHALTMIAQGGFGGSGIGQAELGSIYSAESDSVFAVICGDMGIAGGVVVLMLYFLLMYRGFKISLSTTNPFNKAVSMGISVMLGMQTFIIVGGIIKMIPFTGITLPFISRGGSSMLATFIAMGMLQAISGIKGEISDEIE